MYVNCMNICIFEFLKIVVNDIKIRG
jgi:hypothetical protein